MELFRNTSCWKVYCAADVSDNGSELKIGETSSDSSRVDYVNLRANTIADEYTCFPQNNILISRTCIRKSLLSQKYSYNPK